jgi:hypothetical protein
VAEHQVLREGPTGKEQSTAAEEGDGRHRSWLAERVLDDSIGLFAYRST